MGAAISFVQTWWGRAVAGGAAGEGRPPLWTPSCASAWTHVLVSLGWAPSGGISGSYANFMSDFLGDHRTVFQSGCTVHTARRAAPAPVSPRPCWCSVPSVL